MTKQNVLLPVVALLCLLLFTIHVTDDVMRGFDPWGPSKLTFPVILVVWLYAALVIPDRRAGLVIIILAGVMAAGMPALHMKGAAAVTRSGDGFLFIWTLFAVSATGAFSAVLAIRALWSGRRMTANRE
jgi:hypothetical protein